MICGPFGFMENTKEILGGNHVNKSDVLVEVFKAPDIKVLGKDLVSDVEIKFEGKTHLIKVPGDKSILRVAMANNIALPYSCRSGVCAACKATCVSGDLEMTSGHFLNESEVKNGSVLTCISYPKSDKVVIEI